MRFDAVLLWEPVADVALVVSVTPTYLELVRVSLVLMTQRLKVLKSALLFKRTAHPYSVVVVPVA